MLFTNTTSQFLGHESLSHQKVSHDWGPTDWVWVLCAYQVLQTSVLLLQQVLGARFFVRESWGLFPEIEYWDYHPITPPADIESGGNQVDCIICLEPIELRHGPAVHGHGEDETAEEDVEHERDPLLDKTRESLDPGRLFGRFSYMVRESVAGCEARLFCSSC